LPGPLFVDALAVCKFVSLVCKFCSRLVRARSSACQSRGARAGASRCICGPSRPRGQ